MDPSAATTPNTRKRPRTASEAVQQAPVSEGAFIQDQDAADSGADDDDDDDKPKDKKAGRRKIKIEFIQDKSRRHITFSKRKAGIMKKAYELSTLTGTQVLLLVVSETGLVYTFTTAKLQPLVTQPEGKNLIQACLNAPQGQLPSSMPVGTPIGRSGGPVPPAGNVPGGLAIDKDDAADSEEPEEPRAGTASEKRRRRSGSTAQPPARAAGASPNPNTHSPAQPISPALGVQQQQQGQPGAQPAQLPLGSPGGQNAQPPAGQPQQQQQQYGQHPSPGNPAYGHHPAQPGAADPSGAGLYGAHMMPPGGYYGPGPQGAPGQHAMPQQHWGGPPPPPQSLQQGAQYGRR